MLKTRWPAILLAFAGLLMLATISWQVLWTGATSPAIGLSTLQAAYSISLANIFLLKLTPLSAFFALLLSTISIPVILYGSTGFKRSEWVLFLLFLAAMFGVIFSTDLRLFLITWELMTLSSFGLIVVQAPEQQTQHASWLYLVMAHVATACLLIAFSLLSQHAASFNIELLERGDFPWPLKTLLAVLLLIGFGTKMGLVPLHNWLPEAHSAAPSPVSALMSGVMVTLGFYGLLLFGVKLLAPLPEAWGLILASLGILSALVGAVAATTEQDYKKVLAYSTIENMGIVLLALGLALAYQSHQQYAMAQLALSAALLHAFNHAGFKSLLFLSAGTVYSATHTRQLNLLGGLIRSMPYSAMFFFVGACAICAFPPFNGFIGEWLVFQALLLGEPMASNSMRLFNPITGALLGLVGALVIATFVRVFGTVFLGLPRSRHAQHSQEASAEKQWAMGLLAALCLGLGLYPTILYRLIQPLRLWLLEVPATAGQNNLTAFNLQQLGLFPLEVFGMLLLCWLLLQLFLKRSKNSAALRYEDTWSCGIDPLPTFSPTASGLTQPIHQVFQPLRRLEAVCYDKLYLPFAHGLLNLAQKIQPVQAGGIHVYVIYILLTLMGCLIWIH